MHDRWNPLAQLTARIINILNRLQGRYERARLVALGVQLGQRVTIYGRPIVTMAPDSRITIGDDVVICSSSRHTALGVTRPVVLRTLGTGAELHIGNDVGLSGTVICAATRVVIGDSTLIGANVTIVDTDFHPLLAQNRRHSDLNIKSSPIHLQGNNFIGANSTITKGVVIGHDSVVGTGSIVTKSVPPQVIVAGNPARFIGPVPSSPTAA